MPDTVAVFVPTTEHIPINELHELTALENITEIHDLDGRLEGYRVVWENVQLEIAFPDNGVQHARIDEFMAITDDLLDGRKDKKARKIWRRAERMEQVIDCTATPDWDDERKAQALVQGIMGYYDYALMFANRTVYNENGNIEVGHDKSEVKYWEDPEDDSKRDVPNDRKKRSLQILNREKVPFIKHLRNTPEDHQVYLRSTEEIAERAIALNLISRRADGEKQTWFNDKVAQYNLADVITEQETTFNEDADPPKYISIMFSGRLEAYWCMLWALSYVNKLARPDNFANVEQAHEIIDGRSREQFVQEARLRPKSEILDALDLHFRYHWALVDAELYGNKAPAGLIQDVVYQRHYALNWMLDIHGQAWDAVTTDT
ncbi:MAG: DUF4272 domain-containing protein [Chloroflexota bacterium]